MCKSDFMASAIVNNVFMSDASETTELFVVLGFCVLPIILAIKNLPAN